MQNKKNLGIFLAYYYLKFNSCQYVSQPIHCQLKAHHQTNSYPELLQHLHLRCLQGGAAENHFIVY